MYGMLLESVQYYLIEKYGEPKWEEIRQCAGIRDHVFVTHERYSEASMKKIADSAEYVLGERTDMTSDDFMEFFGSCFVKFLSHYGYDRVYSGKRAISTRFCHRHRQFARTYAIRLSKAAVAQFLLRRGNEHRLNFALHF